MSMLPPFSRGGMVVSRSGLRGATPITPQNGSYGMTMSLRKAHPALVTPAAVQYGSVKSSASRPNPGSTAFQPQPLCFSAMTSHLERVAGLGAADEHRPGQRVDLLEAHGAPAPPPSTSE